MEITAPKDGFVVEVLFDEGKEVKGGTPLIRMDDYEESREENRLKTMQLVRGITAEQLTGKQFEINKKLAQIAVDLAAETLRIAEKRLAAYKEGAEIGAMTVVMTVLDAESNRNLAALQKAKAEAQLQQFDLTIDGSRRINEAIEAHMAYEKTVIERQKSSVVILAPVPGKVSFRVGKGSFAELGSVLAVIE